MQLPSTNRKHVQVELDLDLNAYANACAHQEKPQQHVVKQQTTVNAREKALQAADEKAQQELLDSSSAAILLDDISV